MNNKDINYLREQLCDDFYCRHAWDLDYIMTDAWMKHSVTGFEGCNFTKEDVAVTSCNQDASDRHLLHITMRPMQEILDELDESQT